VSISKLSEFLSKPPNDVNNFSGKNHKLIYPIHFQKVGKQEFSYDIPLGDKREESGWLGDIDRRFVGRAELSLDSEDGNRGTP
jgi:hypothetical protein